GHAPNGQNPYPRNPQPRSSSLCSSRPSIGRQRNQYNSALAHMATPHGVSRWFGAAFRIHQELRSSY
ncbi:hypothetical protein H0H93_005952, partial [Arthromyces matolae]